MFDIEMGEPSPCHRGLWQPNLDCLVDASGGHDVDKFLDLLMPVACSVGLPCVASTLRRGLATPSETGHKMSMCLDGLHTATRRQLPDAYRVIIGGRKQELPCRMKDERADPIVVTSLLRNLSHWARTVVRKAHQAHKIS